MIAPAARHLADGQPSEVWMLLLQQIADQVCGDLDLGCRSYNVTALRRQAKRLDRRARAQAEGWVGEIERIDMTITVLRAKRTTPSIGSAGPPSTSG